MKLGVSLWLAGLPGVIVAVVTLVPPRVADKSASAPLAVVLVAGIAQSAVLLALAVWAGTALASHVHLGAPSVAALVTGQPFLPELRPQILPGFFGGALGATLLIVLDRKAPVALARVQADLEPPLTRR